MKVVSFKTQDTESPQNASCGINPDYVTHIIEIDPSTVKVKFIDGSYIEVIGETYESVRKKLARGINETPAPVADQAG